MSASSLLMESSESCCTVYLEVIECVFCSCLSRYCHSAGVRSWRRSGLVKPCPVNSRRTGRGHDPRWSSAPLEIVRDESAPSPPNVLAQLSRDATAGRFPLAIWEKAMVQDGGISIVFKTVDASIDQAAGIVWRSAFLPHQLCLL